MQDGLWNSDPVAALAEAERRIEESGYWWHVRAPQLTALERLPANLAKVGNGHLDISGTRIADLSDLAKKPDLKMLTLNEHVSEISAVGLLAGLEELVARKAPIRDVSPLRHCSSLRKLQLNVAEAADLSPLSELPHLERLELWNFRGQALWSGASIRQLNIVHPLKCSADLMPLTTWSELQLLACDAAGISGSLPVLPSIDFLSVPGCGNGHFRSLSGYVRLRSLFAYDGEVSDLEPLAGSMALETVGLSNTRISDLTPLLDKAELKHISIDRTNVSNIASLSWLPRLERLSANDTPVADLSGWNLDSSMQSLSLAGTQMTTASPLHGTKLRSLNISRTAITDLGPKGSLANLRYLEAASCPIQSIAALTPGLSLQGIDLTATNVSDLAPLRHARNCRTLLLRSSRVKDLTPLAETGAQEEDHRYSAQQLDFRETPAAARNSELARLAALAEESLERCFAETKRYLRAQSSSGVLQRLSLWRGANP